jgi:hypothetical protein
MTYAAIVSFAVAGLAVSLWLGPVRYLRRRRTATRAPSAT